MKVVETMSYEALNVANEKCSNSNCKCVDCKCDSDCKCASCN